MKPRVILISLLLVLFSTLSLAADVKPEKTEIRAVWMDRGSIPKTEQGIREMVRAYDNAGINILHPETIFNGYSSYKSSYLTQKNLWGELDVLSIIIDEAHKRGMEVHPWVWVFRAGNLDDKGGILTKHPEWSVVYKDGNSVSQNGSYWLCPSIPAVRILLISAFKEMVEKYPIDGLHLDYIRFDNQKPSPSCYNNSCRLRYEIEYGIDPLDIEPFTRPVIDWHVWRETLIDSFVNAVGCEVRKINPDIKISAAVAPHPDSARLSYLQNWTYWANNGYTDFLSPMVYTPDSRIFQRLVNIESNSSNGKTPLAPGIGLHLIRDPEVAVEQVKIAQNTKCGGVTLFAGSYINKNILKILKREVFNKKASIPKNTPPDGRRHVFPSDPPIFIPKNIQPLPEIEIPEADSKIIIDGKLDDQAWKKAAGININKTNLGENASEETMVFLTYDENNIYAAFIIDGNTESSVKERDGPVFNDDSIEVFLQPSESEYFHFAVNAAGIIFDEKNMDSTWNADWTAASNIESEQRIIELAIPFSSIKTVKPQRGGIWRANFCRNKKTVEAMQYTSWSAVYGSYHTPTRFGYRIFK